MSIKNEVISARQKALQGLLLARDEAKLRLHLLSLEARQRWDEIEPAIVAIEQRAAQEGERASEALNEKIRQMGQQLRELVVDQMTGSAGLLTNVRSVMSSKVCSCSLEDSLNRAAQLMWEGDCGIIPVTDQGKVVGLVTDRDICMASYTQGRRLGDMSVASAMSQQVFSCAPDDSIGDALAVMAEKRIRRLPVLAGNGELVGMLTLTDLARFARSAGSAHVDAALAETLGAISKRNEVLQAAAE